MKTKIIWMAIIVVLVLTNIETNAQITTLGNTGGAVDFVGWNRSQGFPLQIRHNGTYPMDFFTDSIQRMRITAVGEVVVGE